MRTAWTPDAPKASSLAGEANVSGRAGKTPVTINQFPAVMLNVATLPSAATRKAAYIKAAYVVAQRHRFAPT
ncbi:hypothetical protein XH94_11230 [Bradyrhizobium zhanjiangense]|uniref:Uncharacterized protein n=1 Tax=Bradyrhizobium zhanjiangense TaxID=1325107 RepID=A0A4Q0SLN7_9BRAD|nr:hypothetical protein XH94_11230 [Bradyrhizobium zhanjiangense]